MKQFTANDKFFYKAKEAGYRARSAFKLLEIQEKFNIIKKNQVILDLGAFPGSWLQVTKNILGDTGHIIGLDIQEIEELPGVNTYVCDVFSDELPKILRKENIKCFDIILSDMAPNTSGMPDVDQYRSVELNLEALQIVRSYLKTGGWAVFKIFKGEDFNDFWLEAKKILPNIKTFKPTSSRDRSVELFCVGRKI